jgi:maintenance of morphology protein 1
VQDPIQVHAIDLGCSSPRLSNARAVKTSETSISVRSILSRATGEADTYNQSIELDLFYTDTVSVSISTAVLVNFPKPAFARLPVSLTISLSVFSSQVGGAPTRGL